MLSELKGYIGFISGESAEAPSGLYVDALPDITQSMLEDIARIKDGEIDRDAWSRIEDRAILKFRTLFIAEINKCHKVTDIKVCECLILSNKEVLATSLWYLLGAEVMLSRKASSRINVATIDKTKLKELREYFEDQFAKELTTAVNSIDIHASECFGEEEHPEPRQLITYGTPIL